METASLERPVVAGSARAQQDRILSLDVFRGFTIASMVLVNDPGSWKNIYEPFEHAEWHGWTFTDTVFPFFLWIVGVSITFSFARRVAAGADRGRMLLHILRRSAIIFALGLLLSLIPRLDFAHIRIPGVLQRIAVCYLCAATIFLFTSTRARIFWVAGLLYVYWWLMMILGGGVLDPVGNLSQKVDQAVLTGHMYSQTKIYDPEGIVSTLPAIATVLFGILAGQLVRSRLTPERKAGWLYFSGALLILAGLIISAWMPINKKIWTDSFSLFMAGLASVVFASWYWLLDVLELPAWRRWTRPFAIFGMNAIAAYVLAGMLAKTLLYFKIWEPIYNGFGAIFDPKLASLLFACGFVGIIFGLVSLLYRRQWFLRI